MEGMPYQYCCSIEGSQPLLSNNQYVYREGCRYSSHFFIFVLFHMCRLTVQCIVYKYRYDTLILSKLILLTKLNS